jgi:hypothetical protein
LILDGERLTSPRDLAHITCPCWCYGIRSHYWDFPPHCHLFATALDVECLGRRLLAWLWVEGELSPACFAGLALSLNNGRMSVATIALDDRQVQITVVPMGKVGGDMALYWHMADRTLTVLADAIGHGDIAALDVAQFMLDVVRLLRGSRLSAQTISTLCCSQRTNLARGRFVAVALTELDPQAATLTLANAGMPAILCLRDGRELAAYASTQPPLGLANCPDPIVRTVPLQRGCQWTLTSDGANVEALRRALSSRATDFASVGATDRLPSSPPSASSALPLPLEKIAEIIDDASQIILFIAN